MDAMDHVDNIITGSMCKEEEQLHENEVTSKLKITVIELGKPNQCWSTGL